MPTIMHAEIPCPPEIHDLDHLLRHQAEDCLYVVGGAVRDWLFYHFHGDKNQPFQPKDLDLTTNMPEREILRRLGNSEAHDQGVRVYEKQSVDTFGVVFATVRGVPFEIAPFRRDMGIGDGRRPASVKRGTIEDDAMRRDFTINNLYYDFVAREIIDFNPGGQGLLDIQNKVVRFVGNPLYRIQEDVLRTMRFVRFYSRLNNREIIHDVDKPTYDAITAHKNLISFRGMSHERICSEFLLGLKQSLDTCEYVFNLDDLDLLQAVLPNLSLQFQRFGRMQNVKNIPVILAALLRDNDKPGRALRDLCYSSEIFDRVQFLVDAMRVTPDTIWNVLRARDKWFVSPGKKKTELTEEEREQNDLAKMSLVRDIEELCDFFAPISRPFSGPPSILSRLDFGYDEVARKLRHLAVYEPQYPKGEELMARGFQGPAIGEEQRRLLREHYIQSLDNF